MAVVVVSSCALAATSSCLICVSVAGGGGGAGGAAATGAGAGGGEEQAAITRQTTSDAIVHADRERFDIDTPFKSRDFPVRPLANKRCQAIHLRHRQMPKPLCPSTSPAVDPRHP